MTKMQNCFECYGSRTGVCKNTGTIFRDKECVYYVDIFDTADRQDTEHGDSKRGGDNL